MTNAAAYLAVGHFLVDWSLALGHWSLGRLQVSPVVRFHLPVGEPEQMEQAMEDEAAEFGGV